MVPNTKVARDLFIAPQTFQNINAYGKVKINTEKILDRTGPLIKELMD